MVFTYNLDNIYDLFTNLFVLTSFDILNVSLDRKKNSLLFTAVTVSVHKEDRTSSIPTNFLGPPSVRERLSECRKDAQIVLLTPNQVLFTLILL